MDDALGHRLDEVVALLVLTVSLLAGLVFGRGYGDEGFLAVVSLGIVGLATLVVRVVR